MNEKRPFFLPLRRRAHDGQRDALIGNFQTLDDGRTAVAWREIIRKVSVKQLAGFVVTREGVGIVFAHVEFGHPVIGDGVGDALFGERPGAELHEGPFPVVEVFDSTRDALHLLQIAAAPVDHAV